MNIVRGKFIIIKNVIIVILIVINTLKHLIKIVLIVYHVYHLKNIYNMVIVYQNVKMDIIMKL